MVIQKMLTETNYEKANKKNKYIVIHYTANDGDTALNNCKYFYRTYRGASAHYFVDEKSIWQCVEDKDIAWSVGASRYKNDCRNSNSINIELCSYKDKGIYFIKQKTAELAAELVATLMKKYNIPLSHVIRHYDVTGKNCPAPYVERKSEWTEFKEMCKDMLNIEEIKINVNGEDINVNRILINGENYIKIRDLGAFIDIGYNNVTKKITLDTNVDAK